MGGRVEGLAWADPVARTPIGASGNFIPLLLLVVGATVTKIPEGVVA